MELRFVALALRKLWWLIALFAVLGIILARSLGGASTGQYESQALLLVRPSTSFGESSPCLAARSVCPESDFGSREHGAR